MQLTLPPHALEATVVELPFPVPAFLSLAAAGDVKRNAKAVGGVLNALGISREPVLRVSQTHSQEVVLFDRDRESLPAGVSILGEADGICSAPGGPWLAITVADCLPLYCYDRGSGAYALLHSGWRGTGILETAVDLFVSRFDTDPADLVVLAGPGIHASSYEVDHERADEFATWGEDAVVTDHTGRTFLDLYAANRGIAKQAGIGSFTEATHCTAAEPAFGSYRRQGAGGYTSMLALLGPVVRSERSN